MHPLEIEEDSSSDSHSNAPDSSSSPHPDFCETANRDDDTGAPSDLTGGNQHDIMNRLSPEASALPFPSLSAITSLRRGANEESISANPNQSSAAQLPGPTAQISARSSSNASSESASSNDDSDEQDDTNAESQNTAEDDSSNQRVFDDTNYTPLPKPTETPGPA